MLFTIVTELYKNPEINAHHFSGSALKLLSDTLGTIISNKEDTTNELI